MQWILIKDKVQEKIENHIPTRKIKTKRMKNKYHWNAETIEIIRRKHRVWQRYRESGCLDEDKLKIYHSLRKKSEKGNKILSEMQKVKSSR